MKFFSQYKLTLLILFLLISFCNLYSQSEKVKVSGFVYDSLTGKPIDYATIRIEGTIMGAYSNKDGYFEVNKIVPHDYVLVVQRIGYVSKKINLNIKEINLSQKIQLKDTVYQAQDLIVTANRRVQSVQEISNSAFIIDNKNIRLAEENNFEQLLKEVPGVEVYDESISIRGSDGFDFGIGSRTLMMVDGIPLMSGDNGDSKFNLIPLNQVSRVEIVKGAGSALYGSSAIGGVINLITSKNRDIADGETHTSKLDIETTYGIYTKNRYPQWQYSNKLSSKQNSIITFSQKKWNYGYAISGNAESDDSYRAFDDKKKWGLFGQIYYNPKNAEISLFALHNSTDNADWVYWNSLDSATIPPTKTIRNNRIISDKSMIGLTYFQHLTDKTFWNHKLSFFRTYFANNLGENDVDFRQSEAVTSNYDLQTTTQIIPELVLTGGLTFSQNNISSKSYGLRNQQIFALYSQFEYRPINSLIINLGARYDLESVKDAEKYYEISPKFGLNYTLNDNIHIRASAGKGFRAPTIAESFAAISYQGFKVIENINLKPETSWNFELGGNLKLNQLFVPLELDGTAFLNYFEDLIEPGFTDNLYSSIMFQNLTSARISGLELSLIAAFSENIIFSQNITLLDPIDTKLNEVLKFRSKYFANTSISYNYGIFNAKLNYRFVSKVEKIDDRLVLQVKDAQARVPIHVLDLYLGFEFRNFENNILGKKSSLNLNLNFYNLLDYYYTYMVGNLAPTRFIGLTLKLNI